MHGTGLFKGGDYDAGADTQARLESAYTEAERREIESFYVSRPFFYQIENVYALADLVVARGGAGSLYEIASLGLPAIVIPKSNLPGDHQVMNARAMARCGGAVVIYEGVSAGRRADRRAGGRPRARRRDRERCARRPADAGATMPRLQPERRAARHAQGDQRER